MSTRILILGAGFGGLELSTVLSEGLGEAAEVTLIDKNDGFVFGFSKLDVMFGRTTPEAVRMSYGEIAKPGVRVLRETVTSIDPQARTVTTDAAVHEADVLVIALGADYDMDATPGCPREATSSTRWRVPSGWPGSSRASLQVAARNMQGLYWLYPADEYGPWLQVTSPGYPFGFMKSSQIRPWVTSLGGTPALITNAVSGHTAITGYPSNGVDFQVVAGAGTPTEAAMKVEENPAAVSQPVTVWYASGDDTVPLVSATEGASEGKPVPIPIHYVCKVGHVALPGNATVQTGIEAFLLKGEAITGLEDNCPYTGVR